MADLRLLVLTLFVAPCLPAAVSVTIASNPAGRGFTLSGDCAGGTYSTPQTLSWPTGGNCTVTFDSPQGVQNGSRYVFGGWQDGNLNNPRTIATPDQATTYTANFVTQYLVTTAAAPPNGGTVSGGNWYPAGAIAILNATPANGYKFAGWNPPAGVGPSPTSLNLPVGAPITVTANFAPAGPPPPGNYGVSQIAVQGGALGINSSGQVVGSTSISLPSAYLWTPLTTNGNVGEMVDIGGLALSGAANFAVGINSRGQVAGNTTSTGNVPVLPQAFLWTPATPNATTGSVTAILGGATGNAVAINSFGQVAGNGPNGAFLWTPAAANGTTGTVNSDPRLNGIAGINDFGQAIVNGSPQPMLFTPSSANGSSGTFAPVPGLPGSISQQATAINKNGAIVGTSCVPGGAGACATRAFLWTPAVPNGTSGTVTEIPLPAGYASLNPLAMNTAGQVVGAMTLPGGGPTPFLYSGGTVYDLSNVGSQLLGGIASGINDQGQVIVNAVGGAYLLTPGAPPPPQSAGTVAVTIASAAAAQAFTVSGSGCGAGGYNTPQTLYWMPGANCSVLFLSPHTTQIGSRYLFNAWQDGPVTNPRVFVAPNQTATYTASFTQQVLVSALANPPEGGTVSGGGWFAAGSLVTLTATAANGYRLLDWTPSVAPAGSTTATFPAGAPQTVTANFVLLSIIPPSNYQVTQIAIASSAGVARPINNFGQVVGISSGGAFLWTPIAANSPLGDLTDIGGLPLGSVTNSAAGINDLGQVIGVTTPINTPNAQPFLWTPNSPNATAGTASAFLGTAFSGPAALSGINGYGQVAGSQYGPSFLWTPSSPNGSSGTLNTDGRLVGIAGINDYGQAIMGAASVLFTPSAPHGNTGTFTPVPGLPGASNSLLIAINNSGVIVGMSCIVPPGGIACRTHGFIWTPSTPNGTAGSVTEIPLPPGYILMTPTAINGLGQVVGMMARTDQVPTPFLYSGGSVYDLSTVNSQFKGDTAAGINDHGQIVISGVGVVYLITPAAAPGPPPLSSVPVTFSFPGPPAPFTVTGSGCSAGAYATPQTLYWAPGASCTVAMVSPHSVILGTRLVFANWQDGGSANPRVFAAPQQPASYVANFSTQLFLSVAANPPAGGTVSGGGWYNPGATATLTATANAGYRFLDWTPSSVAAAGVNTASFAVNAPQTVTANFVAIASIPPNNYQITQINPAPGSIAALVKPINNYGQVLEFTGSSVFLWTPVSANSASGNLTPVLGLPSVGPNDLASAINDQGQIAGTTIAANGTGAQHFLWSPANANGAAGSSVAFLGSGATQVSPGGLDINTFGQISGNLGPSPFLWTPFQANGTSGSTNTDNRLIGIRGINDFGQAIMFSGLTPTLFTPSSPHGSSGTFTPVFGLAGAVNTMVVDINAAGVIAGASCIPTAGGAQAFACNNHAFLWTPTSPNGTAGTAVEIPLPAGVQSMTPAAINANGQMIGIMIQSDGTASPFVYIGGSVYDLSTVGSQVRGGSPVGINDRGQIVINALGSIYLMTPMQAQLPAPTAVSPGAGSGLTQTMTFTFTDPRGPDDLDVVNILINNFLDGRNACYLAYSRPGNVLYLVNDPGTALLPGVVLNGSGGTANSQCSITVAGTPTVSGNTLSLTLGVTFSASFAGNKVVYMAARDRAQNNSGWQALGTWGVPGFSTGPTSAVSADPPRGSGASHSFTFTFAGSKGWPDLGVVNILINNFLDGRNACYLAYSRPYNVLYLVNDAGTLLLPGLSNSQCSVAQFTASGSGNALTLTMTLNFTPGFAGNRVMYLAARDNGDLNSSGWQALGSWTVQ